MVLDKILNYLQGDYGLLKGVGIKSIFWYFAPIALGRLSRTGLWMFILIFAGALIHTRLFHIFFVLVMLEMRLPKLDSNIKEDKEFWIWVLIYAPILFLWTYLELGNLDWWMWGYGD